MAQRPTADERRRELYAAYHALYDWFTKQPLPADRWHEIGAEEVDRDVAHRFVEAIENATDAEPEWTRKLLHTKPFATLWSQTKYGRPDMRRYTQLHSATYNVGHPASPLPDRDWQGQFAKMPIPESVKNSAHCEVNRPEAREADDPLSEYLKCHGLERFVVVHVSGFPQAYQTHRPWITPDQCHLELLDRLRPEDCDMTLDQVRGAVERCIAKGWIEWGQWGDNEHILRRTQLGNQAYGLGPDGKESFPAPTITDPAAAVRVILQILNEAKHDPKRRFRGDPRVTDAQVDGGSLFHWARQHGVSRDALREAMTECKGNGYIACSPCYGGELSQITRRGEAYLADDSTRSAQSALTQSSPASPNGTHPVAATLAGPAAKPDSQPPNQVFVVHGRDLAARNATFSFLRALGVNPIEWSSALKMSRKPAPYVGEILEAAFAEARAIVVLLTPDDLVELRPDLRTASDKPCEHARSGQARPNVLFEAGMAFATHSDRTVLVQVGDVKEFSDIGGRHVVHMSNDHAKRHEFATKLQNAGCEVDLSGTDWTTAGDFSDPQARARNT